MTARTPLSRLLTIGLLVALWSAPGCKPDKPDVVAAARAEASKRAHEATQASAGASSLGRLGAVGGLDAETAAVVVARVGESTITLGDMARFIASRPRMERARYASPDRRRELLNEMVRLEVLAQTANGAGLARQPMVQMAYKKALAHALLEAEATAPLSMGEIDEAEVVEWYETHQDELREPERREALLLMLNDAERARAAHRELSEAVSGVSLTQAMDVFSTTVAERSIDRATKARGGALGRFDRAGRNESGQLDASVLAVAAAFELAAPGDLSAPVELENRAWAILLLTSIMPARVPPLDEVRIEVQDAMRLELRDAVRAGLVEELRAQATIEVDEAKLGLLEGADSGAAAGPGGATRIELDRGARKRRLLGLSPQQPDRPLGAARALRRMSPDEVRERMNEAKPGADSGDPPGDGETP